MLLLTMMLTDARRCHTKARRRAGGRSRAHFIYFKVSGQAPFLRGTVRVVASGHHAVRKAQCAFVLILTSLTSILILRSDSQASAPKQSCRRSLRRHATLKSG